jgi:hypothetical protein
MLGMIGCSQDTITDAALAHLAGIEELQLGENSNRQFSPAALDALGDAVTWEDDVY